MKSQKKLSNAEVASFCEELSLLISSGITPLEALGFMREDSTSKDGKDIIHSIQQEIVKGGLLYEAIASTSLFPEYVVEMIKLGEETGNLDLIIRNLATYYQQQVDIRSGIRNALAYPCIMVILMMSIIIILLTEILPIFNQVFMQLGSELTGFAKGLLNIGKSMQAFSSIFLFLICILILCILLLSKTSKGKTISLHLLQTSRLTRNFFLDISYSRFASCFALVSASGINIYFGLDMINTLINNEIMSKKIASCKKALSNNEFIYDAFQSAEIFKPSQLRLLQIAYKTGGAENELLKISRFYEEKVLLKIQKILAFVEPTLVILFSLIIGIILLSVIFPLVGIMSNIG